MLLVSARQLPGDASAEISFEGKTVGCLTGAFILAAAAADPDGDFPVGVRHPSLFGFGVADTGQVLANWKNRQHEALLLSTCPLQTRPESTEAPLGSFGSSPPLLDSVVVDGDSVRAAFRPAARAATVLAYLDGILVAWAKLPGVGAGPINGEPVLLNFPFPGFMKSAESRFTFFTTEGLQLLYGPQAPSPGAPQSPGLGIKFSMIAKGMLDAIVVNRPTPQQTDLLALYAVHTEQKSLSSVHKRMIRELKKHGAVVCVINSFHGNTSDILADAEGVDLFVSRADLGRDFGSWCSVFEAYSEWIRGFDRTLFINDSIVGPLIDTAPMFAFFEKTTADFSALSDSHSVFYHLQSSIFQIRSAAWRVEKFARFFTDYPYPNERTMVVEKGELGLSKAALEAGLSTDVMCPYDAVTQRWLDGLPQVVEGLLALPEIIMGRTVAARELDRPYSFERRFGEWAQHMASDIRQGVPRNVQHTFWDALVRDFRYPFIKREVLTSNPEELPSLFLLKSLVEPEYRGFVRAALREVSANSPRVFGTFHVPADPAGDTYGLASDR